MNFRNGYSEVNNINMYFEIYGEGKPLVLIHGGGSTIETSFGQIIPFLAGKREIIALELQAHGHTSDRNTELTFEQDAEDTAELLKNLSIKKADFLGFSNGGHTTIELALRHPEIVNKIILASTFYKRSAVPIEFWNGFDRVTLDQMPRVLIEGYLKANNNEAGLLNMFNKDVQRMKSFSGWSDEQMHSIKAPALVMHASKDVVGPEHAVEMYRIIPNCELAIFPGMHGEYLGTLESLNNGKWMQQYSADVIHQFLG